MCNRETEARMKEEGRRMNHGRICAFVSSFILHPFALVLWFCVSVAYSTPAAPAGTRAHFLVLTSDWERVAPLSSVDVTYGPRVDVGGRGLTWWQIDARSGEDEKGAPLFSVRCLSERDPLAAAADQGLNVARYSLRP